MTKGFALAALLLSACAADVEISVGPERGADVGVATAARVTGTVRGVTDGRVVLGNDHWLASCEIADGGFSFEGVPNGVYFARVEVAGFATTTEEVVVTGGAAKLELTATAMAGGFTYLWERDDLTRGGHEQGSAIGSAREVLRATYGIELSDEDQVWSDEHAARLLQTMLAVPQPKSAVYAPVAMAATTWVLSSSGGFARSGDVVQMPATAFATGRFVAEDMHREIVAYVTHDGHDRAAVDKILSERYGVRAWLFSDSEVVSLISMLEDMPAGLQSMPALKTMIRRTGGEPVRASVAGGYLEIGDRAFETFRSSAQRDLVREKARFMVTPALQAAWGQGDVAAAIAEYVTSPDLMTEAGYAMMSGLHLEAQRPIESVAIQAEGRNVTIELGLTVEETSSARMYLFNGAGRYTMVALDPVGGATGSVVRGHVTLAQAGTWRPDVIVLSDRNGVATVRDISEVGWQLAVE